MNHAILYGSRRTMGRRQGAAMLEAGVRIPEHIPFPLTRERREFAAACRPVYEQYFPQAIEEIRGMAEGQRVHPELLETALFSMYCIMPENKCSCFGFREGDAVILGRNSDFLTGLEGQYLNCIYHLEKDGGYSFLANTTAFVEMEDGVNEHGLAIGLTSVCPDRIKPGLNAGMLLRLGLETCRNTEEWAGLLERVPSASSHTFVAADREGRIALFECSADRTETKWIGREGQENGWAASVNAFHLPAMRKDGSGPNDWQAEERYETIQRAFEARSRGTGPEKDREPSAFASELLSGRYGFLCQYDRGTGHDTVWSAVYDLTGGKIYRCEGNPGRGGFFEDRRFRF